MATVSQRHPGGRPRALKRNQLGRRIESLLTARGLTLEDLAKISGITPSSIYRIATGDTPDPKVSTIKAIADVLGVTIDSLVSRTAAPARGPSRSVRRPA